MTTAVLGAGGGKYPTHRWNMGRVRALLDGRDHGWIRKSMLVTAWQSAGPGLDEVHAQKENAIVAGIVQQTTRKSGVEENDLI
ncbi:hypothetical protein HO173_010028 [Letharia columbiana]|uniref:Uncharacterized protein n=1 Tax=Letharia columbiana TaxID=112416 RepID=A0A8H6FNF2_9LECA|nr:uncharacterized protein HO173_010028 [Letharia columbiana]KAF6231726.1 hypothetical protein HO173_010028 [Letharia columbiana]